MKNFAVDSRLAHFNMIVAFHGINGYRSKWLNDHRWCGQAVDLILCLHLESEFISHDPAS